MNYVVDRSVFNGNCVFKISKQYVMYEIKYINNHDSKYTYYPVGTWVFKNYPESSDVNSNRIISSYGISSKIQDWDDVILHINVLTKKCSNLNKFPYAWNSIGNLTLNNITTSYYYMAFTTVTGDLTLNGLTYQVKWIKGYKLK